MRLNKVLIVATCFVFSQVSICAEHAFGSYTISIDNNVTSILSRHDYSVAVFEDGLLLSRLTVACDNKFIISYVSDLDSDEKFEVIIVVGQTNSRLDSFKWTGLEMEPFKVAPMIANIDDKDILGISYAVEHNRLIMRMRKRGRNSPGVPVEPSYLYSASDQQWVPIKN